MSQQGFRTLNGNPYVYQETTAPISIAYGIDTTTNLIKIKAQSALDAQPTGVGQITIDPAAVGNITLTPNGAAGRVVIDKNLTVSAGTVVMTPLAGARPCTVRASVTGQLSTVLDPVADGQLYISSAAGVPLWANITSAGGTVLITNGANSINLEATASAIVWNPVPGNVVNLVANNGYMLDNVALTTATLPVACAVGSVIRIVGSGSGLFTVAQNAGQSIKLGTASTTVGVLGGISSANQYDALELLCIVTDTTFAVLASVGNFLLS